MKSQFWKAPLQRSPLAISGVLVLAVVLFYIAFGGPREPEPVGGPEIMRRLTEDQYRASIADIFAPDIPVTARFERPVRSEGLVAIGTGEAGMSPFAVEQYSAAAQSVAGAVLGEERRAEFMPCAPRSARAFDEVCARRFLEDVGYRLFRRPLSDDETRLYVAAARNAQHRLGDFHKGIELSLYSMLMAPDFLFRIERAEARPGRAVGELDAYSKATRLSYFLTNSAPDRELLQAAADGDLDSRRGVRRQVDRLMKSPRFEGAVRAFFSDMMQFDRFDNLSKDPTLYPAFSSELAADAKEQSLKTIVHHLIDGKGDYRDLFTTTRTFLTRPLGIVYRTPVGTRKGWEDADFDSASGRAGIHTHVSFLALHSHPGRPSPTLRGLAIRDIFLCQHVPDPPPDVNFTGAEASAHSHKTTARERLVLHMTVPACAGCHKVMDPPGFTLENFDGVGAWREREDGTVIDPSGSLDGTDFNTSAGLSQALRNHPETPRCVVEKLYKSAVGRGLTWDERPYLDWLIASFETAGYRFPALMRTIALSDNFFAIARPGRLAREPDADNDKPRGERS